ncbi:MAG: hypothetical protein ACR2MM_12725 [Flavobacteriaceae bacterium]
MKRIQLFEFEDFQWFPKPIRRSMTNLIAVLHRMVGTKEVIAGLLSTVISDMKIDKIVDLGSGSGGIMPEVLESLESDYNLKDIELTLTDLYPNKDLVEEWSRVKSQKIYYHPSAVDATDLKGAPQGIKTMINSFHHMNPEKARAILESAQKRRDPLFVYEMGENNIPLLLWWILLPLSLVVLMIMVLFMTPWARPLSWQQLVFTYLIPVIPLCYAWDGQASLPRMYTMKDMDMLLEGLHTEDYQWKKGRATKKNKKKLGTYLIGLPVNN